MFDSALRRLLVFVLISGALWLLPVSAHALLAPGPISDFDDGTVQGWTTQKQNTRNAGDYLEVAADPHLSVFNASIEGVIDPAVTAIDVDLLRPAGSSDLEIRLVLFGPQTTNRWTSTAAASVIGDGVWRRYRFSIRESDLTQVLGTGSYADLTADLARMMFREDSGAPSASGENGASGVFGIDEIVAVPEPTSALLLLGGLGVLAAGGRRQT